MTQQYWKKLQDPRWQKRRLEIFSNAEFKCEECGSESKQLHAHHLRYVKGREPWEYEDFELRCLCDECHSNWHRVEELLRIAICAISYKQFRHLAGYATGMAGLAEPDQLPDDLKSAFMDGLEKFG